MTIIIVYNFDVVVHIQKSHYPYTGTKPAAWKLASRAAIWLLWSALCTSAIIGSPTFCPLTSPDDDMVYITDNPSKLVLGVTKTQCGLECAMIYANCRCFNYNETSMNCSLFDIEPTGYSVDSFMNTIAYEVSIVYVRIYN